jgi:hypothetical protein
VLTSRNAVIVALGAGLLAAGCQESGLGAGSRPSGAKVSAPGVPVAVETIEGAPAEIQSRVQDEVVTQAGARRIDLVSGADQPRYRLRGYVSAYSTDDGDTALALVWDVFDATKKRAQRVSTTTIAKGQASDPWSRIGSAQIARAASDSMDGVASFLASNAAPPADAGSPPPGSRTGLAFTQAE